MAQVERYEERFGWRSLAEAGIWSLVLSGIATMVFVIEGIDPALAITIVVLLVGLALTTRDRPAGPIVLVVATVIFLVPAAFFAIQVFLVPRSTVNFVVNAILIVAGITTLIASIALIRRKRSTGVPHVVGLVAVSLVGVLTLVAIVVRLGYDQPAPGDGDLSISADDNEFIPAQASARAGRVAVIVGNEDLSLHTFSIDELDVSYELPGGVRSEVAFEASPGTYEYFCAIPGHEDMKGTLKIR